MDNLETKGNHVLYHTRRKGVYFWRGTFFKGELYRLKVVKNKACTHHAEKRGDYIIIYVSEYTSKENRANVLWTWYREQLTPIMERFIDKWEQILGVKATTWTIQQMQSSWGKCHKESGKSCLTSS